MCLRTLIVATHNRGKLAELRLLLAGLPVEVRSPSEVCADMQPVVEDGTTFAENAIQKARAAAHATGMIALADDSGLEVDALGGLPGVRSARFAGDHATDGENNAALLAALRASGKAGPFRARFRCVLALLDPALQSTEPLTVEGVCEGTITSSPCGSGGFGYDPLFVVAGTDKTMAELTPDEKSRLSHRARALASMRPLLERCVTSRTGRSVRHSRGR